MLLPHWTSWGPEHVIICTQACGAPGQTPCRRSQNEWWNGGDKGHGQLLASVPGDTGKKQRWCASPPGGLESLTLPPVSGISSPWPPPRVFSMSRGIREGQVALHDSLPSGGVTRRPAREDEAQSVASNSHDGLARASEGPALNPCSLSYTFLETLPPPFPHLPSEAGSHFSATLGEDSA